MPSRLLRLVVVPALLFLSVTGLVAGLAQEHPARADQATAAGEGATGPARGEVLFAENCAGCHGEAGRQATVGPDLAGNPISLDEARTQIELGGGGMPADLVEGQQLEDVLAYLETILAGEPTRGDD